MLGIIMKITSNWSRKILPLLAWTVFTVACDDGGGYDIVGPSHFGIIGFSMVGDTTGAQDFVAVTNDIDLVNLATAENQLLFSERTLFPIGPIDRGDGGHNFSPHEQPEFIWNWHFLPDDWTLTDAANPICDGNAVIVEQAIDYWVDTVGQLCPSGARVVYVVIIVP
jgi:hypothetical protein